MGLVRHIGERKPLREVLREYLQMHQAEFLEHALSPNLADSFHGIHQMRVATKRIRSVYRLMEWLAADRFNARRELVDVRKYFKLAGAVRDIQMREKLLMKYCDLLGLSFPRYEDLLRETRVRAQRKLRKRMPSFSKKMLVEPSRLLLEILESMEEKEVVELAVQNVELRTEEMAIELPPDDHAERLHKVRILLKENLYVMTQVNESASGPVWVSGYLQHVKRTGDVAGDWHDLDVFLDAIDQLYIEQPQIFPDDEHFMRLREVLDAERKKSLRAYRKAMKRVIEGPERIDTEGNAPRAILPGKP